MIKAIIFDVGGVLHTKAHVGIIDDICKYFAIEKVTATKIYKELIQLLSTGKIDETEFWKMFAEKNNISKSLPKLSLFIRTYKDLFEINHDVYEIVKKLKSKYKLGILSNTILAHAEYNRKQKLFELFDEVVLSHEVGLAKPDERFYNLILTKLNIEPEEAVFIDDLEDNVQAAINIGLKGIVYTNAKKLREDLRNLGVLL